MHFDIYHATIDSDSGVATQEYYIRCAQQGRHHLDTCFCHALLGLLLGWASAPVAKLLGDPRCQPLHACRTQCALPTCNNAGSPCHLQASYG